MKDRISCIIPAYNERKRIGSVLKTLQNHHLISEIIVVDDGSIDGTKDVVKKFRNIQLISHKKNKGKTQAIIAGIKKARGNLFMFIDADLQGLTQDNITALISPLIKNEADISISIRGNSLGLFKILGIDFISGERVFKKELLGNRKKLKTLSGFGFESYLNKKVIEKKLRIKIVKWKNVSHARKSEKLGFIKGTIGDLSMIVEIIKTIGFFGMISQMIKMKALKV